MAHEVRNENIIYTRVLGCRGTAGDPSDRKYSRWENGRHRNHESSARARRRRQGLVPTWKVIGIYLDEILEVRNVCP